MLSRAQMRRIAPYFPLSHGVPRVDDRLIVSAIIFVIKNGLRWRDAPRTYGPHKTIFNRFIRWSRLGGDGQGSDDPKDRWKAIGGVFNRIFCRAGGTGRRTRRDHDRRDAPEGAQNGGKPLKRVALPRCIGRTKGGLNSKLHAVCDGGGRPIVMLLTEGQTRLAF